MQTAVTIMDGSKEPLVSTTEFFRKKWRYFWTVTKHNKNSARCIGQHKNRRDVKCPELELTGLEKLSTLEIKLGQRCLTLQNTITQ